MEGENSTTGPQPYQPYEAEVTNSPISNNTRMESVLLRHELSARQVAVELRWQVTLFVI